MNDRNEPPAPSRSHDSPIDKLRIDSPCHADWDAMEDRGNQRYCEDCKLCVFDLEKMRRSEAMRVLEEADDRVCMRITRRPDGSIVTLDDTPTSRRGFLGALTKTAAAMTAFFGAFGCTNKKRPQTTPEHTTTGMVCPEEPESAKASPEEAPVIRKVGEVVQGDVLLGEIHVESTRKLGKVKPTGPKKR